MLDLLKIEQEFQNLLNIIKNYRSNRLKLSFIINFFDLFADAKNFNIFQSYFQQILPDLVTCLTSENLQYRSIGFLTKIINICKIIENVEISDLFSEELKKHKEILNDEIAKTYFYLGEWLPGIKILFNIDKSTLEEVSAELSEIIHLPLIEQLEKCVSLLTQYDINGKLINIYTEWKNATLLDDSDHINTLLIERDEYLQPDFSVSTIQPLSINSSLRSEDSDRDMIFFSYHSEKYNDLMQHQALDALHYSRALLDKLKCMNQNIYH